MLVTFCGGKGPTDNNIDLAPLSAAEVSNRSKKKREPIHRETVPPKPKWLKQTKRGSENLEDIQSFSRLTENADMIDIDDVTTANNDLANEESTSTTQEQRQTIHQVKAKPFPFKAKMCCK